MMKKRLNDLKKTGELCFLYYDEDDTEIFLIGTIEKVDREFFVMSCYTLNGEANGFTCRLIQSIIKIETKHAYIESVQKLIDGERHAAFPAELVKGTQCLAGILEYIYQNQRVCFIELCESSNVDAVGLIGELDRQTIMMYLYTECGQQDGEVVLDYEAISSVTVGGKLQDRIERLMKE